MYAHSFRVSVRMFVSSVRVYKRRCEHSGKGGIRDRRHPRRKDQREESVLAIDVAGRFKEGTGKESTKYRYALIASFNPRKETWKELDDEPDQDLETKEDHQHILKE